jgi:hypothetical protein
MTKAGDDDEGPCVILAGTVYDGFRIVGPFPSWDAATAYDNEHRTDATPPSPIIPLIHPSSGVSMDDLWLGEGEHFSKGDSE